jgi:plasmid maintenance system antidote protein VapI
MATGAPQHKQVGPWPAEWYPSAHCWHSGAGVGVGAVWGFIVTTVYRSFPVSDQVVRDPDTLSKTYPFGGEEALPCVMRSAETNAYRRQIDQQVGRTVRALMHATNTSQTAVAECIGLQQTHISRKLSGDSRWYAAEVAGIAEYFGVDPGLMYAELDVSVTLHAQRKASDRH